VIQLGDLHKISKTFTGVSIATTGIPSWKAEQTCKAVSNAIGEVSKRKGVVIVSVRWNGIWGIHPYRKIFVWFASAAFESLLEVLAEHPA